MKVESNKSEAELYKPIMDWLSELLKGRFPRKRIEVLDTSRRTLANVIEENGWTDQFRQWETFEVHIDIAGLVFLKRKCKVFLIEVKSKPISLRDLGQLTGYCKVVRPSLGLIVSPQGLSRAMSQLLEVYGRIDLLDFGGEKFITIGKWDSLKCDLDFASLIPRGALLP